MAMLVGEPGIGKTRAAEELARVARKQGFHVLWGGCYEGEGAPLYWPWTQAVRELAHLHPSRQLAELLGARAAVIAEVVAHLHEHLEGIGSPPRMEDPVSARFRLFDAMTTFLRDAGAKTPLLVVLDDLHWADEPSLLLLEFVAHQLRGMRLMLLGTYRDVELRRTHPLSRTLGDLTRERLFERVALRGLGPEEVKRYIEQASGAVVPKELSREVHERTEGNALFVTEVVRLLVDHGELVAGKQYHRTAASMGVPEGVREAIGRRLDRLSKECNGLLQIAAVAGREFGTELLERIQDGLTAARAEEILQEALEAKVVEERAGRLGAYRFTHALVQETLIEELSLARQVRLHASIVGALEELYGEGALAEQAEELAGHCVQAEPVLGTGKLVRYLLAAGEQALGRYAHERATQHFRRGIEARGGGALDEQAADLYFGLGRAQAAMLDDEAIESFLKAFDFYEKAGLRDKAVAVAAQAFFREPQSRQGTLAELCERALRLVEPHTKAEAEVLAKLGITGFWVDADEPKAKCRLERALEIARREGDRGLEGRVLAYWAAFELQCLRCREAIDKARSARRLAQATKDPRAELISLFFEAGSVRAVGGELREERRLVAEQARVAERLRDRGWLSTVRLNSERLALLSADWQEARRLNDLLLADDPEPIPALWCHRIVMEARTGGLEAAEPYLRRYADLAARSPPASYPRADFAAVATQTALEAGQFREELLELAEAYAWEALEAPSAQPMASIRAEWTLWNLAVIRRDAQAASGYLARAQETHTPNAYGVRLPLLERTAGSLDHAIAHFREVAEATHRQGMTALEPGNLFFLAETLLQKGTPEARLEAEATLARVVEMAGERGMVPLEQRAQALLAELAASPPQQAAGPSYPDGLTEREVEVLRLVAQGKTNKEIAFELYVSTTTVNSHVQSILRKIGVSNRVEAAAYALRKGLAAPAS